MTPDVSWQPLSIDSTGTPPPQLDRTGAVALIPCGDRAWAAGAAVTLARSLARGGRRVFLCDLDLATPRLHTMVGLDRGSGVSDFILYGASPSHVSVELEERLLFVSAGTPVTAYEAIYGDDRWDRFVEAATHARACLLFLVPVDVRGASQLLARAETLVALGSPGEVPDLGDASDRLRFGFHRQDLDDWAGAGAVKNHEVPPIDEAVVLPEEEWVATEPAEEAVVPSDEEWAATEPAEEAVVPTDEAVDAVRRMTTDDVVDGEDGAAGGDVAYDPPTEAVEPEPAVVESAETESWTVDQPAEAESWIAEEAAEAAGQGDPAAAVDEEVLRFLDEGYAAGQTDAAGSRADDDAIPVRDAWVRGERPGRATGGIGLWVVLFLLVVVAILVAGWMGWIDVPGISSRRAELADAEARIEAVRAAGAASPESPSGGPATEEASPPLGDAPSDPATDPGTATSDAAPSPPATTPSEVVAPLQGWALRLGAFRGREAARSEADRMAARAPNHLFVVVPVEVGGNRWYRVVSGLATDQSAGERLRADLALKLQADDADQWLVRRAPLAFLIDELDVRSEADGRVADLRRAGIDAYVMAADRTDGGPVFRVYAGAFADAGEASTLRALLDSLVDLAPPLVERRGTRPE